MQPSHREHPSKKQAELWQPVAKKANWGTWVTGSAVTAMLLLFFSLLTVIATKGLGSFWVAEIYEYQMRDGTRLFAQLVAEHPKKAQYQVFLGNRDVYGLDYRWIDTNDILMTGKPSDVVVVERYMNGKAVGRIVALETQALGTLTGESLFPALDQAMTLLEAERQKLNRFRDQMARVSKEIGLLRRNAADPEQLAQQEVRFRQLNQSYNNLNSDLEKDRVIVREAGGARIEIPLLEIHRAYQPNRYSYWDKTARFFVNVWTLLSDSPRSSNTEGGLFPAIFGTVMLVLLMSVLCVPLGVVAAVYLKEYAKKGLMVSLVRISVNNLAGVPSIIYGVFGLGFFVYGIGGQLDQLFFSEKLPIPTFGTGGLLWAAITMALLTLPVVIVATEEGLESVPQGIRDGSMAMGATKFQTLIHVVLPMASPGILTGFILAIARAAGEVAPLMLVGVIKSAPTLPVSQQFPYLHLDQKFMHLGYHLYDQAFLSPSVEASKPMVFATSLLLLMLVLMMSTIAMILRNHMRKRFISDLF